MDENFDLTYKALFRRYYPSLIFYATRLVGRRRGGGCSAGRVRRALETKKTA